MHEVIHTIISDSQAGFIPGRKIGDNIILAHELVKAYTRKNVAPRSMLKIDLQKAYDFVEWPFLEQLMEGLSFPDLFTQWVMKCVKTVNYTIVVNGQNTQRFDAAKGLRQGDPMSPFLWGSTEGSKTTNCPTTGIHNRRTSFQILRGSTVIKEAEHNPMVSTYR